MAQARLVVLAMQAFEYRGETVEAGDTCLVRPIDAAAFTYRHQARWPTPGEALGVYRRRDLVAEHPRTRTRRTKKART